ncbi:hypothetical protein H9Y04_32670 [Streptomyces sp. TRM66268-LWL]|uniref:Integral membrane protein n=1 Tax=Streptomyces polyasparticus TaxID=2767826 RepID=A0ABR7SP88_9ACTN|nr:hypothetical protein [Streptomyces polyasparticus]MBC9717292.1 hypothetical protein [Streptomyces polyasparticus]
MSQSFPPPQPTDGNPYAQQQPGAGPYGQQPAGGNPFGQQPAGGAFPPPVAPARQGNVALAIVVGVVAALIGAAIYGGLMRAFVKDNGETVELSYVAVVVGALVGFAVGKLGGRNPVLPIVSAVLAVVGVYLGQIFGMSVVASYAVEKAGMSASWTDFLTDDNILRTSAFTGWKEEADAMTYLFIALGGFIGFGSAKKIGG